MKLKTIAVACAMAFASQAYAVGPTPAQAAASQVPLFISGSSALQNTIGQVANGLFTAGSISVFYDGTATAASGKNYRAYAGTFSVLAGATLNGLTGVLYETAAGGSIVGVVPVAQATTVARINLTTCGAAAVGTDSVTGAPLWSCTGSVLTVPDAGVSDVEPALFTGINVPAGGVAASPAVVAALTTASSLAQPMGIIVTPNTAITNLTKPQVTSLMNGLSTDWSFVDAAYAAGPVVVCRRVAGSGTQAAINASFFGFPCSSSQNTPATAQAVAGGYTVIENSSSGALAACMTAAQRGLDAGYTINITNGTIAVVAADATHVTLAAGNRAVGLMGVDRLASVPVVVGGVTVGGIKTAGITGTVGGTVAVAEAYNFLSINGVAPTVNNASTGAYDTVVNSAFNKRTLAVGGIAPLAGLPLAFYNALIAKSGDKVILGTLKTPAVPGVLTLADANTLNFDATLGADGLLLNPVMRTTKANTCQPAAQVQ